MNKKFTLNTLFILAILFSTAFQINAQCANTVSLTSTSTYTQNFDTLASSGTSSTLPAGFSFVEGGSNANTTYTAGTGSGNSGDTYSFGTTAAPTDRALGSLNSGTVTPIRYGACFTNNTSGTLGSIEITYTGEQYRVGGTTATTDTLTFEYSTNATSLTTGTWTPVTQLNFTSPVTSGTAGFLDGNAAANRTTLTYTITGLSIPVGGTFFIRFTDVDVTNPDQGLAIDDLSLTPSLSPSAALASIEGFVRNSSGKSIHKALVTLTDSQGNTQTVISDWYGRYRFTNINVGETYVLSISFRDLRFQESTRVITVNEDMNGLDFVTE